MVVGIEEVCEYSDIDIEVSSGMEVLPDSITNLVIERIDIILELLNIETPSPSETPPTVSTVKILLCVCTDVVETVELEVRTAQSS